MQVIPLRAARTGSEKGLPGSPRAACRLQGRQTPASNETTAFHVSKTRVHLFVGHDRRHNVLPNLLSRGCHGCECSLRSQLRTCVPVSRSGRRDVRSLSRAQQYELQVKLGSALAHRSRALEVPRKCHLETSAGCCRQLLGCRCGRRRDGRKRNGGKPSVERAGRGRECRAVQVGMVRRDRDAVVAERNIAVLASARQRLLQQGSTVAGNCTRGATEC